MKIECIKEKIQEVVTSVERIANKNATLPILQCLLFIAKENTLTIKATNLDVGVEIKIPVKVIEEGVVAIPAYVLAPALNNIKKGKIIISENNGILKIEADKVSLNLKSIPNDDFPLLPRVSEELNSSINIKDLVFGLKSVVFSVSISSIKPELGSVYLYQRDGYINFVGTDSFRLAEKRIQSKKEVINNPILLPLKNVQDLIKVFDNTDGDVKLSTSKNQISIESDYCFFTCRIVDGIFPDYEQIIPKEPVVSAVVLKQDFADALKTSTVVMDKYFQVVVDVNEKSGEVVFESKNNDVGDGKISINGKITGENLTLSFSQKYLNDAVSAISDDSFVLKFGGNHKPLLIEGVSNKLFRYLVMPMNR